MSDNIQEAEVGSGTKVADTKQSEKRAQLTLKAIQLRMKQEKERAALQQQKKSLSVKEETMTESFSPSQIALYLKFLCLNQLPFLEYYLTFISPIYLYYYTASDDVS